MTTNSLGYTEVFAWGSDNAGQMGLASKKTGKNYPVPRFCSFNVIIHSISCGDEHSAFIASNGYVYTMGSNIDGRLGISSRSLKNSPSPCLVEFLARTQAIKVSCGGAHTAALMETGEIFTWGNGSEGQLGIGTLSNHYSPQLVNFLHPQNNKRLDIFCIDIECGTQHTGVISDRGELYMFGSGAYGQLGTGRPEKEILPTKIDFHHGIAAVSCGVQHTLILTEGSRVYACGSNSVGQLGTGNHKTSYIFQKTVFQQHTEMPIKKIAAGQHSAAVTESGDLYIWGSGSFGEFLAPHKVASDRSGTFVEVSIGDGFGCAVDSRGNVYSWGDNHDGELGTGNYEPKRRPVVLSSLEGKKVLSISCGGKFSMALGMTITNQKEPNLQSYRIESGFRKSNKRRGSLENPSQDMNKSATHIRKERGVDSYEDRHNHSNVGHRQRQSFYMERPNEIEDERSQSMLNDAHHQREYMHHRRKSSHSRTFQEQSRDVLPGQRPKEGGFFDEGNRRRSVERPRERERSRENTKRGVNISFEGADHEMKKASRRHREREDELRGVPPREKAESASFVEQRPSYKQSEMTRGSVNRREREEEVLIPRETREETGGPAEHRPSHKASEMTRGSVHRREKPTEGQRGSVGFQSIADKTTSVDETNIERDRMKRDKSRNREKEDILRRENDMMRENLEELKKQLRDMERIYVDAPAKQEKILQRNFERLEKEYHLIEKDLKMEKGMVVELKRVVEDERRQNGKYLKELDDQRSLTLRFETELRKVQDQQSNMKRSRHEESEKEVEFLRMRNEELQRKLAQTSEELSTTLHLKDQEIEKLEKKVITSREAAEKLEDTLKRTHRDERNHKEFTDRLERENDDSKKWVVELQVKLSEAQAKLQQYEKEKFSLKDHNQTISEMYEKKMSIKDEENMELRRQLEEYGEKIMFLEKDNRDLKELVKALEDNAHTNSRLDLQQSMRQRLSAGGRFEDAEGPSRGSSKRFNKTMGVQRSHDFLARSEDSMLIPKKESDVFNKERTLHRDNRSVNLDNNGSSEKKLRSGIFNEQSIHQRGSFEENQYRKRKDEDDDVPTREDFESQPRGDNSRITNERSPILRYITNHSSPDQQRSVIKLQAVDNEEVEEIEKERERQRQEVEIFHKQNGDENEGEGEEDYSGELLRGRGNLIDISTEMRSVNMSNDYASQNRLQEQINRSAAKIMQLLNIKPSHEGQGDDNGKRGATMFGRETNNVTAKFAATDFVEASRDEGVEVMGEHDAQNRSRGSLSRSRSPSPDRIHQENYGHITLGEKMKMALREGKENFDDDPRQEALDSDKSGNFSDLRHKLQDLQKNKLALEQRMQDFEKKLKDSNKK